MQRALRLVGVTATSCIAACGAAAGSAPSSEANGGAGPYRSTETASGALREEPDFRPLRCDEGEYPEPLFLDDLRPASPVDYVELRRYSQLVEATGTPCATALDPASCGRALELLPEEPGFPLGHLVQIDVSYHLRATRADSVLRVGTLPELRDFLGQIDTAGEAELWVASRDYELICSESGGVTRPSGFDVLAFTFEGCDGRTRHLLHVDPTGTLTPLDSVVERAPDPFCVVGRRPEPLAPRRLSRRSLGAFLAGSAELEAASVPAFLRLARELVAHGAPRELVRAACVAAREEVRHARVIGRLAREHGGAPELPRLPALAVRKLPAVTLENAVEGCVRETFGALIAAHQAERARSLPVRAAYARIAQDEARHADLAWAVARWAEPRLGASERSRVAGARRAAVAALWRELRAARTSPIDALAGLPEPRAAEAMLEAITPVLSGPPDALA